MNIKNIMACFANQALRQALPAPLKKKDKPHTISWEERETEREQSEEWKMFPQAIPLSE